MNLYTRYWQGIVSDEMLALPKWRFVAIGMLEALGVAVGMSAGDISIMAAGILNNSFGKEILVVRAVASGSDSSPMAFGIDFIWPTVMIASSAFQAVASIIKESVFIDEARRLKRKSLEIFVVNLFGSGFQALFVLLLLPLLSNWKGIPFNQIP